MEFTISADETVGMEHERSTAYRRLSPHPRNALTVLRKQPTMGVRRLMKTIPLKPERQAELEEFARRRGKTPADALDEALGTYLEWERQDFEEAVRGIQQGYDDMKAGRTRPADQFLSDMRQKHGLSR